MTNDLNHKMKNGNNAMDLISKVDFRNGQKIEYYRTAAGAKLRTVTYTNSLVSNTEDYAGRFVYENRQLVYIH